jgi:hypothetical protein
MQTGFWWGNLKGRDLLENVEIDGRATIKRIINYGIGRRGLDSCASGYGKAAAIVNAVMNIRVHEMQGI